MPINLKTINQFFNITLSPTECERFLKKKIALSYNPNPLNLEEQAISLIGEKLYKAFIKRAIQQSNGRGIQKICHLT